MNGIESIAAERERQISEEGWTPQHDDKYQESELASAAACYCFAGASYVMAHDGYPPKWWPWAASWWKPTDRRRDLVKAGALIAAEIDRLDRIVSAEKAA